MNDKEILERFIFVMPYVRDMFSERLGISVMDCEKFLMSKPGNKKYKIDSRGESRCKSVLL